MKEVEKANKEEAKKTSTAAAQKESVAAPAANKTAIA